MKALNDFLLNLFTATDDYRLIVIPADELSLEYSERVGYPDYEKLITETESQKLRPTKVLVSDIAKELTKARIVVDKNSIKCQECEGNGEVSWEYSDKES